MEARILLTGFTPFGPHEVNSSWEAVKEVSRLDSTIHTALLPVDYLDAHRQLGKHLERIKPEILMLCGMAQHPGLKLERQARKPEALQDINGPLTRMHQWPVEASMKRLAEKNIQVEFSSDAGQYVCESTFWSALNYRAEHRHPEYVTFLHMPPLSEQWSHSTLAQAIIDILDVAQLELKS